MKHFHQFRKNEFDLKSKDKIEQAAAVPVAALVAVAVLAHPAAASPAAGTSLYTTATA